MKPLKSSMWSLVSGVTHVPTRDIPEEEDTVSMAGDIWNQVEIRVWNAVGRPAIDATQV
jgi:hypothetical protein